MAKPRRYCNSNIPSVLTAGEKASGEAYCTEWARRVYGSGVRSYTAARLDQACFAKGHHSLTGKSKSPRQERTIEVILSGLLPKVQIRLLQEIRSNCVSHHHRGDVGI